ncbi:MAG: hypothetical protein DLM53_01530 [Candidatus Eremiobacter antarcticus]|nr:MAG: hypothetical protein DLM53_01530 [Candidatus Eremiobacter sp. RRmetagenome_bin22]
MVRAGFLCEDCGEVMWLSQGLMHVRWLQDREHVAREVADHSASGLDTWMMEGLGFLAEHRGHGVSTMTEK